MFLKTRTYEHSNEYYFKGSTSTAPDHDEVSIEYGDVDN